MIDFNKLREDLDLRKSEIDEIKDILDILPNSNMLSNDDFEGIDIFNDNEINIFPVYIQALHPELIELLECFYDYTLHGGIDWEEIPWIELCDIDNTDITDEETLDICSKIKDYFMNNFEGIDWSLELIDKDGNCYMVDKSSTN